MNYYEHHIGDYAKDAGHLSMVEDGAYRRLLDVYYTREKSLPNDVRDCCKLARATTKAERDAVAYVLREFFDLRDDGHHQKRGDEEIERFRAKSDKARRSANARWKGDHSDSERNANASTNAMRTHSEGNAPRARPQSPDTSNQERAEEREKPSTGKPKTRAVEIETWIASLGEDEDAIPRSDTVFAYAEDAGIPDDFLALSWHRFREDMAERHIRKKDWRAHYRNAVKGNWYRLWWIDQTTGECRLTTVGEQARRAAA